VFRTAVDALRLSTLRKYEAFALCVFIFGICLCRFPMGLARNIVPDDFVRHGGADNRLKMLMFVLPSNINLAPFRCVGGHPVAERRAPMWVRARGALLRRCLLPGSAALPVVYRLLGFGCTAKRAFIELPHCMPLNKACIQCITQPITACIT